MNMKTLIENRNDSIFISDVLKEVGNLAEINYSAEVIKDRKQILGTKGEIVTQILLGVVSTAVWELIKTAVQMYKGRRDYDPDLKIHIEGEEYTLDMIYKGKYKEISIKKNK